jgi:phospholipid/cholesterol/gamma-HCH transport system substrate-binding protein
MKNSLETRLGIFFALVFVAAFVLFEMVGGGRFFDSGIPIKARFNSAGDLKVGDPVKLAGVDVGRVQTIRIADGKVEVSMTVEPAAGVRTDSKASIKFSGMMGQNFMAIDFGNPASPVASTGALLESREQPDLAAIMSKLESAADGMQNMTKSFSGEDFTKLLGPMTDMIKDNQPRIASILSNLDSVTTGINKGEGTLGRLLKQDTLYVQTLQAVTNLIASTEDLKLTLSTTRQMMADMNSGKGTIGRLLVDDSLFRETTNMITNLREVAEKLNRGNGTVGQLINDDAFLRNLKLTLQKVEKATETLEDAGPLQVIGTAAGSIF